MLTNTWHKSSRSNPSGNCVEARRNGDQVEVRDTKLGESSPVISIPSADWALFLAELRAGHAWPAGNFIQTSAWPAVRRADDQGLVLMEDLRSVTRLMFTLPEWVAFVAGAKDGQFDLID